MYASQGIQYPGLFHQTKKGLGGFWLVQSRIRRHDSPRTTQAYLVSPSALDQQNPNCCYLRIGHICLRSKRRPCLQMPANTSLDSPELYPRIQLKHDRYLVVRQSYHHHWVYTR